MKDKYKWHKNGYFQEIVFFTAMFILTMLHDWIQLDSFSSFFKGLAYFFILYGQAQFYRFLTFPIFLNKRYSLYTTLTVVNALTVALFLFACNYYWLKLDFYEEGKMIQYVVYYFVICVISCITMMLFFLFRQYTIELQKRNQDQLLLSDFVFPEKNACLDCHKIAPLVFITLIEKAFKHSLTTNNRWFVSIRFKY